MLREWLQLCIVFVLLRVPPFDADGPSLTVVTMMFGVCSHEGGGGYCDCGENGDDGCGIPEGGNRREPDGPTVMESDRTEVESACVTNSAGEDVND